VKNENGNKKVSTLFDARCNHEVYWKALYTVKKTTLIMDRLYLLSIWTWQKFMEWNCACYWWYKTSCLYFSMSM